MRKPENWVLEMERKVVRATMDITHNFYASNSLQTIIQTLTELEKDIKERLKGSDVRLSICRDDTVQMYFNRPETDVEVLARLNAESIQKEKELAELARLKAKYEGAK